MQTTPIHKAVVAVVIFLFTFLNGYARAADAPQPAGSEQGGKEPAVVITADTIESHLRAIGFQVPDKGSRSQFTDGDGIVNWGLIPRPFGAPQADAPTNAVTQYGYECKQQASGAMIKAKIEASSGRFLFFASGDQADAKAMRAMLRHMDTALAKTYDGLVREAATRTDAKAPSATQSGVMIRVTELGTILSSEKMPAFFGAEESSYGLADNGDLPLIVATEHFQVDRVLALLMQYADPKVRTKGGNTALHVLCEGSHGAMSDNFAKIAAALIEMGADPNAKNNDGRVPLDLAHPKMNSEMVQFMREHGAKW